LKLAGHRVFVEEESKDSLAPKGLRDFSKALKFKKVKCHTLLLEVPSVFYDTNANVILPEILRDMHHKLTRTLRRSFFYFTRNQTPHKPEHFHVLGQRSFTNAVKEVDKRLAQFESGVDFLLLITPTNIDAAWRRFKRLRFEKIPEFFYRPLPVDPLDLKRALFSISISHIEDPALYGLFREQLIEFDRRLSMLEDRGTPAFMFESQQLFGRPDHALVDIAKEIVTKIPPRSHHPKESYTLDASEFARLAESEIVKLRAQCPSLQSTVSIREDISGVMVTKGNVLIGKDLKVSSSRAPALIQHEVGTHVVTQFNGTQQPFGLLSSGLGNYEELQEGIAVAAEFLAGGFSPNRLRVLAGRVIAVDRMLAGADFIEVFRMLNKKGFPQRGAFQIAARVFRGGGLTKDIVYLRGLQKLVQHINSRDDIAELLIGKIGFKHLAIVRELRWRRILITPALIPRYLTDPKTRKRFEILKSATSPLDLLKQDTFEKRNNPGRL
jgi:uncharacterized protein (TIGR02421 family)